MPMYCWQQKKGRLCTQRDLERYAPRKMHHTLLVFLWWMFVQPAIVVVAIFWGAGGGICDSGRIPDECSYKWLVVPFLRILEHAFGSCSLLLGKGTRVWRYQKAAWRTLCRMRCGLSLKNRPAGCVQPWGRRQCGTRRITPLQSHFI